MIEILGSPQIEQLKALLEQAELPNSDLEQIEWFQLVGLRQDNRLLSAAGLEQCNRSLLLRSVITHPDHRSKGYARQLVTALHQAALEAGYDEIWLLTIDASDYFSDRYGYSTVDRSDAPKGIQQSSEFRGLCPTDATLMRSDLA
ncbi:MAG: arsenic resistance N-acetyltransferase ArsN2 [bacterium]